MAIDRTATDAYNVKTQQTQHTQSIAHGALCATLQQRFVIEHTATVDVVASQDVIQRVRHEVQTLSMESLLTRVDMHKNLGFVLETRQSFAFYSASGFLFSQHTTTTCQNTSLKTFSVCGDTRRECVKMCISEFIASTASLPASLFI